jgi:hypothetical protein
VLVVFVIWGGGRTSNKQILQYNYNNIL